METSHKPTTMERVSYVVQKGEQGLALEACIFTWVVVYWHLLYYSSST